MDFPDRWISSRWINVIKLEEEPRTKLEGALRKIRYRYTEKLLFLSEIRDEGWMCIWEYYAGKIWIETSMVSSYSENIENYIAYRIIFRTESYGKFSRIFYLKKSMAFGMKRLNKT